LHSVHRIHTAFNYVVYAPVEMDEEKDLESVQKDQKKVWKAGSNPETSGPAEELREKAADMTDESEDSNEPA
jgi:hypothetical protein